MLRPDRPVVGVQEPDDRSIHIRRLVEAISQPPASVGLLDDHEVLFRAFAAAVLLLLAVAARLLHDPLSSYRVLVFFPAVRPGGMPNQPAVISGHEATITGVPGQFQRFAVRWSLSLLEPVYLLDFFDILLDLFFRSILT